MSFLIGKFEKSRYLIVKGISIIYLISYLNILYQISILWGNNGLLPVKNIIELSLLKNDNNLYPSIIPFLYNLKINLEYLLYFLCFIGIILSLLILIFDKFLKGIFMFILWFIYLNFYKIGQNFFEFEFDYLLLEIGFVSIFLCDFYYVNIKFLNIIFIYVLKLILFKYLFGKGLSIIFSENKSLLNFEIFEMYLQNNPIPSKFSYYFHRFIPFHFKKILSVLIMSYYLILPIFLFAFLKKLNQICGEIIIFFSLFKIILGREGCINLIILIINLCNFDDEIIEYYMNVFIEEVSIEEEEEKKKTATDLLKERKKMYENDEQISCLFWLFLDFILIVIIILLILILLFPMDQILSHNITLEPNNLNNLLIKYFGNLQISYYFMIFIIFYIFSYSFVTYFSLYENEKKNPFSLILFSLLSFIYIFHSIDIFYSGFNESLTTKQKGNILYSISEKSYNLLNDYNIVNSYQIYNTILNANYSRREELLIRYTLENDTLNNNINLTKVNETLSNENNTLNNNNNNSEKWYSFKFKYHSSINDSNSNLNYFHCFICHPRLDFAFQNLAYNPNIKNNIWLFNLLSKILKKNKNIFKFSGNKIPNKNIEKIKVESYFSYFDYGSNKTYINKYRKDIIKPIKIDNLKDLENKIKIDNFFNENDEESLINKFPSFNIIVITILLIIISVFSYNFIRKK